MLLSEYLGTLNEDLSPVFMTLTSSSKTLNSQKISFLNLSLLPIILLCSKTLMKVCFYFKLYLENFTLISKMYQLLKSGINLNNLKLLTGLIFISL